MTVLVTGGAGYIGSHMVHALLALGEDVVVVDNLVTGFDWAVPPAARFERGDIADRSLLDRIMGENEIDAVIHFAGSVVVPESVRDPLKYYDNNTAASRLLIEACVAHGVPRFIFSSTAAVYGEVSAETLTEDAAAQPINPYGRSKLMTEWMLRDVSAAHDLEHVALRYFNVAGADPDGRTGQSTAGATHLIKVACETALGQRSSMAIFGTDYETRDGTAIRDYIHVSDLIEAHVQALRYLRNGGKSLTANVGYGRGYTVKEVVAAVERQTGAMPVELRERRAGDSAVVVADASRARDVLEWTPRYDDLDLIVKHALAWQKALDQRKQG
ncbi:UDP-glucose 4-epimerase GalE [Fulvimarina endophytica]|uniref:UDP-glucose 4-epimerase n=1 Tax=Fulvimarina endophytica TaxID=2293836 RepID=A0A371X2I8_9HYPH|nr:UDP-glucose 4-epimerase GalE [Fulvimarina endophytica]RFC63445.1 UDP-glucose 4-epimerase GalE [Fulvimarina endophytica]